MPVCISDQLIFIPVSLGKDFVISYLVLRIDPAMF